MSIIMYGAQKKKSGSGKAKKTTETKRSKKLARSEGAGPDHI